MTGVAGADHALLRPDWPAPANVRACVTTRGGMGVGVSAAPFEAFNLGAHCGDAVEAVLANRAQLHALAGLPAGPRWLRQVHGTGVVRGDAIADGAEPQADAALTAEPGIVLAVLTADCLPVLFCARDGSEVAAAHAGWRGLAAGVLEHTVSALRSAPGDLLAWLGPAAGPQAYEVGAEVRDAFVERDPGAAMAFTATRPGHFLCDLYRLARQRLAAIGVTAVHGGGLCTISDPARFFSHRRDGRSGRMASLVWLDP